MKLRVATAAPRTPDGLACLTASHRHKHLRDAVSLPQLYQTFCYVCEMRGSHSGDDIIAFLRCDSRYTCG